MVLQELLRSFLFSEKCFHFSSLSNDLVEVSLNFCFPHSSVGKESPCKAGYPSSIPRLRRSTAEDRLPTPIFLGFPCGSAGKESAYNMEDLG